MVSSIIFAFVAVISLVNGAVVQRDNTPTLQATTSSQPSGVSSTLPTTSVTRSSVPPSSFPASSPTGGLPPSSAPSSIPPSSIPYSQSGVRPSSIPPSSIPQSSIPPSSTPTTVPTSSKPATVPPAGTPASPSGVPPTSVPPTVSPGSPAASPTPPSGSANCDGVQKWQASFAYNAGNKVIFNDQLYTALQWTYNNAPPAHSDQWAAGGPCAQPIKNKVDCTGVAAWQQSVAYTSGNQVTYGGHLWAAVQWTQSNAPGDTSGVWQDQGVCK